MINSGYFNAYAGSASVPPKPEVARRAPFKFLDAYTLADRDIFFGRDLEVRELYHSVLSHKVTVVFGCSGAGKTSLLLCGLLGRLKREKTQPLSLRAIAIQEKAHGPDHPSLANSLGSHAGLYSAQGTYDKSEPHCRRAIAIEERTLGPDPPTLAKTLSRLACLDREKKKYDESEKLFRQSLEFFGKNPDQDTDYHAEALSEYAKLLRILDRPDEAATLETRAAALAKKAPR